MITVLIQQVQEALKAGKKLAYPSLRHGIDLPITQLQEGTLGGKRSVFFLTIFHPKYKRIVTAPYHHESWHLHRQLSLALGIDPPAAPSEPELRAENALLDTLKKRETLAGVNSPRSRQPYMLYDEQTRQARFVCWSYVREPEGLVYKMLDASNNALLEAYATICYECLPIKASPFESSPKNVFYCPLWFEELITFPDGGSIMNMSEALTRYGRGTKVRLCGCSCEYSVAQEETGRVWGTLTNPCQYHEELGNTRGVYQWTVWSEQVEVIKK